MIEIALQYLEFFRARTLGLLDAIEKEQHPQKVLGWRPGAGRAHLAWQMMHIGITEELFATERLAPPRVPSYSEMVPRFKGGSTPDEDIPTLAMIRDVLTGSRNHLVATLRELGDGKLDEIPVPLAARKLTLRDVLQLLAWHEAHHQGQAHITLNLYRAEKAG